MRPDTSIGSQFRRERTGANSRGVGLGNSENVVQHVRTDTGASGSISSDTIAGRDKRIRAMIDIEQTALRTFEKQIAAILTHGVQGR